MGSRVKTVGFDRIVRLEWLELTVSYIAQGLSPEEVNAVLQKSVEAGDAKSEAHRKTRTVLLAIWAKSAARLADLRDRAIDLFVHSPQQDHLGLHWGMCMAAYPFFTAAVGQAGRLLRLQGGFSVPQMQLRLCERFGDRQTVSRAVQRLLRSLAYWGVIRDTDEKGVYRAGAATDLSSPPLVAWLLEATLLAGTRDSSELRTLLNSPALFPFRMTQITQEELAQSGRLETIRHGSDQNLVRTRKRNP